LVRGNGYTLGEIVNRVNGATDSYRAQALLKVFWPIQEAYRQYLKRRNRIDYEDMIILAAKYLEEGRYSSPYKLILVDEFQDLSPGRARLVHALLNSRQDSVLFGVGDDWQAINGFAGSDLNLFLGFETHFGEAWEGNLSQTFRCPRGISDVGAWFIMENKTGQKAKAIRSSFNQKTDGMIDLIDLKKDDETLEEVERQLHAIETARLLRTTPAASGKIEVFILGRYAFEKTKGIDRKRFETLRDKFSLTMRLEYKTVHSSKGLEADYVFCV
jgi:DNA helicase-4